MAETPSIPAVPTSQSQAIVNVNPDPWTVLGNRFWGKKPLLEYYDKYGRIRIYLDEKTGSCHNQNGMVGSYLTDAAVEKLQNNGVVLDINGAPGNESEFLNKKLPYLKMYNISPIREMCAPEGKTRAR